jgi:hypothetical protein
MNKDQAMTHPSSRDKGTLLHHAELQHQTIFQLTALFGIDIQRFCPGAEDDSHHYRREQERLAVTLEKPEEQ